jgi:hypothetical protein
MSWSKEPDQSFVVGVTPLLGYPEHANREPACKDRMCMPGPRVVLLRVSARLVRVVVTVGAMFGFTPIFPQGMALCPKECDKLTRPSLTIVLFCVKSLSSDEKRLQCIPLVW